MPDESLPDCHEGPDAAMRFDSEVRFLLGVPSKLIERRERAYRKKVDANPNRPGPKRKSKRADMPLISDTVPHDA